MLKIKIQKKLKFKSFLLIGAFIGLFASFLLANYALGQTSCPANTTVTGTTVVFVGDLTDMGGDQTSSVWFEYGQTMSYGQKTIEKTLSQTGFYCITVSGLLPSTTYHYRAAARNSAATSFGENKTFTTTSGPAVDLRANGSKGPITVPYNSSVNLSWVSSNVNSCQASGAWSGTKSLINSQLVESLTSSRTFNITCTGLAGSVSDSVTVNVSGQDVADFSVHKTARNLSKGTAFSNLIYADPEEVLVFAIKVKAGSEPLYNVTIKDTLPGEMIYRGDLRIDNVVTLGNILTGFNIGSLAAGQEKTITFRADIFGPENFGFGQTELTNTVLVSSGQNSISDTAKVIVTRGAVVGVATKVPTGLTNNIFFDSFLLPLGISLSIVWLVKSRIIKFEEWLDSRKKEYQIYKSKKMLQLKVAKIKAGEFFRKS